MADDHDRSRLAAIQTVELTTYGRKTGLPRRIEIWWFQLDGRLVITGTPGPRDWYANVLSDPRIVVHVDGADIEGTGTPIDDPDFRRRVFTAPQVGWYSTQTELEELVASAPMIEVHLP